MRNILILGAGKSSTSLIDYLIEHAPIDNWEVTVASITVENALSRTKGRERTNAIGVDLGNDTARRELIAQAEVVISMLPPSLHMMVAKDCLELEKHLVTPSYISEPMRALDAEVKKKGLIFMNEMGLDPGIDHMSAMQIMDNLRAEGKQITGFQSHCGGLVAPESDDNPWHYKITWNPRNVVLAGQGDGGIHYLEDGKQVDLKYEELFASSTIIEVDGYGKFESYPNRDSLKYISEYGLDGVETMYRGTLRVPPFCKGWNCLIKLGLTLDKEVPITHLLREENEILKFLGITTTGGEYKLLEWLDLFRELHLYIQPAINPAVFLQKILEDKWQIKEADKDLVVMVHQISYTENALSKKVQSSLVYTGKDSVNTAMAITVGLPVAIVTKMIMNNLVERRGVLMPKYPEIYNPILAELNRRGITFTEKITSD